jgi:signal transduction histidine kinase
MGKRGGTGLGLDIVRRTAQLADGTVDIGRGKHGGYRVEVRLPERTTGGTDPAGRSADAHQPG